MKRRTLESTIIRTAVCALAVVGAAAPASATDPCDPGFGECKALVEINATDGDVGFHFLMDGDDLVFSRLRGPAGLIFTSEARGPLAEQFMTEIFLESAEPPCFEEAAPGSEHTTLEEFVDRWAAGSYVAVGRNEDGEVSEGATELTHLLPAAPADVDFDVLTGVVTWAPGDDLGECGDNAELAALVMAGVLPEHPENVVVDRWEVVLEPDVDEGNPVGKLEYSVRVPAGLRSVTVPADYMASLPDDTLVKIEVGAMGGEDNATFTEVDGFCVNEVEGCEEE
jgi:hypothetical protein